MFQSDTDSQYKTSEFQIFRLKMTQKFPSMNSDEIKIFYSLPKNQFRAALAEWITHKAYPFGGDLEHVIHHDCISFTMISPTDYYAEKGKALMYTEDQLKFCIRKYGIFRVLWRKFKYNMRYRLKIFAWWFCHMLGADLYSKNEIEASVYQACQLLRKELKPGETLESKILQKFEERISHNSNITFLEATDMLRKELSQNNNFISSNSQRQISSIPTKKLTSISQKPQTQKINRLNAF